MANIKSNKIRKQVLSDYNHCCAACGCTDHEALQIDHVIPQSKGGLDDIENLQVLCYVCNVTIKNKIETPKLLPAKPSGSVKKWQAGRRAFRAYINGLRQEGKNYAYHSTTIYGYRASQSICLDADWNPCHALWRTRNCACFYSYDNIWYCRFYNCSYKGINYG